jgi:hypothetical protein
LALYRKKSPRRRGIVAFVAFVAFLAFAFGFGVGFFAIVTSLSPG